MKNKTLKGRVFAGILAAGMTLSVFTGCGSKGTDGDSARKDAASIRDENQATENTTDGNTEAGSEKSAAHTEYPVTIKTYGSDGSEIETTYDQAPQKVLAVYQGSIETMLALGLEDKLAATAGLDNEVPDDLKAAFSKSNYLDEFTPSLETVTMLEPDMILSWGSYFQEDTLGNTSDWIGKGVNTYMNSNTRPSQGELSYPRTLENEYTDILNLGIIFDVQDKANAIVNEMKDTISKVTEAAASIEEKPTVLILESYDGVYWNYAKDDLGGDMVTALGGVLASPDGEELGKEDVVAADPDVIFVVYMPYAGDDADALRGEKLAEIMDDETFASLTAVKSKHVYPIMLSEMYASATRTQDGIVTFAKGLYPELDLNLD